MGRGASVASREREAGGVQSVGRVLDILEIINEHGGEMTITDIAAHTGLPLPTIHRLLRTLVTRGYAHQTPRRRYALGWRLMALGETAGGTFGAVARPLLTTLVEQLDESVSLSMRDLDRLVYVVHVPSQRSMRMFTEVGRKVELHATGAGKALLSMMPESEVAAIIDRVGLTRKTCHTITDRQQLSRELDTVRDRGYALDLEEQEIGVVCVAVPVRGAVRLALSMSGPTPRMTGDVLTAAVPVLQGAAQQLEERFSAA